MTKEEQKIHRHLKSKIPHYPKLPKYILSKEEKYKSFDQGLKKSCSRGFAKRVSNWMKIQENKLLLNKYTPKEKIPD